MNHRREVMPGILRVALVLIVLSCCVAKLANCFGSSTATARQPMDRYVLDAAHSKFMARAYAGGMLWFEGHDHFVAAREFTGEVEITPGTITPASLKLIVKAGSLVETRDVFTEQQKQIIDKELKEIVLQPDKYPDIVFRSTNVSGNPVGNGAYDVTIRGDLTLRAVGKPVAISARVTLSGNDLRATGAFSIDRSDFNVPATSAVHGMVRIRDKITFTFDIVGHKA